jgi:hypothetical protein
MSGATILILIEKTSSIFFKEIQTTHLLVVRLAFEPTNLTGLRRVNSHIG